MPETVTAAKAAQLVGVSEKTLLRWLHSGKVKGAKVSPLGEAARWEIPVSALDGLRRSARPSDDLAAVVEEMRATVERLEARITALETRGAGQQAALLGEPDRFTVSPLAPSDLAVASVQGHIRPRRSKIAPDDDLDAPSGWVAVPSFVRDLHGVPLRTFWHRVELSEASVTKVRYREKPRIFAENWLTPEQQGEFHRAFRDHKTHALGEPCRVCGWSASSAARPEVPTVRRSDLAAVATLADASEQ